MSAPERGACPDGGTCHHECAGWYNGACWRVFNAAPLSAAGWGEGWPAEVREAENRKLTERVGEGSLPPGARVVVDASARPEVSPAALARRAREVTQEWLDSLGRAPTAEEAIAFAENFAASSAGPDLLSRARDARNCLREARGSLSHSMLDRAIAGALRWLDEGIEEEERRRGEAGG